jgi:hypothetical protein
MKRPALQFCAAGCLRRSETARVETANDKDGLVVNAWRAITHDPISVA